jgi:hypothetical protein
LQYEQKYSQQCENLNFILSQVIKQLDMNQLTHQVERHHLPHLIHRSHSEQPRHDHWVWFSI